ncbi:MAG TPA: cellulase family glycosylhydrolase, partial [Streptosporangiaceae bacterium]
MGRARARGRLGWLGAVAALAMTLAAGPGSPAGAAVPAPPGPDAPRPAAGSCGTASGPFTVQGTQVLAGNGQAFVSYGTTVPGLQFLDWRTFAQVDLDKIEATAQSWCANTVRLQLNQDNLISPGGTGLNRSYLTAIETEVTAAEQHHLVVVLNDNTEFGPPAASRAQKGPTPATEVFWKDLAAVYGHDPQVIFDLFNEPRTYSPGMGLDQVWRLWHDGGVFHGVSYPFGLAELARYVRETLHAQNLFWIEGPALSSTLAGMVSQGALLKVSGVVYSVHHPAGPHDAASWDAGFGYLVTTGAAPVVSGEWTNYEPAPSPGPSVPHSYCWPDAPVTVPAYLGYLAAHGIGLNVYQLQPGYMIRSYRDMSAPTTISRATWSCLPSREPQPGQG